MADASPYALRLSHAASWVRCAAFSRMNRTPQAVIIENAADHTVREEGTAMHEAAHWMFMGLDVSSSAKMSNGVVLDDEMVDAAQFYFDTVMGYDDSLAEWVIERQLAAPRIHAQCGGTPDAFALYDEPFGNVRPVHIRIVDFKGGYRFVDVFLNWQLMGYLAAILDYAPGFDENDTVVEFVIVQPRCYHRDGPVRTFRTTVGECRDHINALHHAAAIAMGDYARAVSGPQCDDCAGRASCSVAHAAAGRALEVAGEPDVYDLPVNALDYEMQRIEQAQAILQARLTGLQAQASYLIRKGAVLPHYALESGQGRLMWLDENAEQAALTMGDLMGADLRKPARAITPLQALHKMPKELIEQYAQRRRGEVKLVRFDSNAAVKAFSHLKKD